MIEPRVSNPTLALHFFLLCSIALAQPVFDAIGKAPGFLVAHEVQPADLLAFVAVPCLLFPCLLLLLVAIVEEIHRSARDRLALALIGLLAGIYALRVLKLAAAPSAYVAIPVVVAFGVGVALAYARWPGVRLYASVLAILAAWIPVAFLASAPVRTLLSQGGRTEGRAVSVEIAPPIVIVVFDEFPLVSLLDAQGDIDGVRFPRFADLAARSTWFRHATTVSTNSPGALTAIVASRHDGPYRLASHTAHPNTLFAALQQSHALHVTEAVTDLQPPDRRTASFSIERFTSLLVDSAVVYAIGLAPPDLERWLPNIDQQWKGFLLARIDATPIEEAVAGDHGQTFRDFVAGIGATPEPALHFLHILLPHSPWDYLPSGRRHGLGTRMREEHRGRASPPDPASGPRRLTGPESRIVLRQQQHLLQLAYVDRLLGELTARLEQAGLFEDALIVVTSDHGTAFVEGEPVRSPTLANHAEVLFVPLFIKLPGQRTGRISDVNAHTIDIAPSILDVLGGEAPGSMQGRSLFGGDPLPKAKRLYDHETGLRLYPLKRALASHAESIARNARRFDLAASDRDLHRFGPLREALGRRLADWDDAGSELAVELDDADRLLAVDPNARDLPCFVSGRILEARGDFDGQRVAIAMNARVEAFAIVDEDRFGAFVRESALRAGENRVAVYTVASSPSPRDASRAAGASAR